ncbi:hypothetical protein [Paenibacillus phytorum]|uniref:hypothetical protein n=1 Tax=Paenibacillus phytorum TaxID=2654977 RepID=UPI00149266CF|nr:hypothetical protein [Paenibacillus phytorum]
MLSKILTEWIKGIRLYRRISRVKAVEGLYPEYYKGIHGYEYRISDGLKNKEVEGSSK